MRAPLKFASVLTLFIFSLTVHPIPRASSSTLAMPSNSAKAFTQVPLPSPSSGFGYALGAGHATWPTLLDNAALIDTIGGGDSILIASTRLQGVSIGLNGSVTYTLPANTFANRVGAIVTANDWTNPTEGSFPLLIASFTFEDGRTWGTGSLYDVSLGLGYPFLLSYRVRDWSDQVVPGNPAFVAKPPNPAVFQLCAQASNGGVGNVYSDLQTFFIPDTLRNTALHTVTFASHTTAFDSSHVTSATGLVTGLVVWPDFTIRNRHGGGLGLQTQFDTGYAGAPYGGYILADTLFGSRGTIRTYGCMLSCMAMANSFMGDSVTVPDLNSYLRLYRGYTPTTLDTLEQINGQEPGATVTWRVATGVTLTAGLDTVLVESAPRSPLVTIAVGPSPGEGTIVARHAHGVLTPGMLGISYDLVDPFVASKGYSKNGRPWAFSNLSGNHGTTPIAVEKTLMDSLPVLLKEPHHYVLARGWRPSMGSNFANGTYLLNDPGHRNVTRLNQIFTVKQADSTWANTFQSARACTSSETNRYSVMVLDTEFVTFTLQGNGHLGITDPMGHQLYFDNLVDGYIGDIPNADGWPEYGGGLDDDTASADGPVDFIEIPGALGGNYGVVTTAGATGSVGLGVSVFDAGGAGARDYVEYPLISGHAAAFSVHVVQGAAPTVQIEPLGAAAVQGDLVPVSASLFLRPNPSRAKVEMVAEIPAPGYLAIDVYDVTGRLVARPYVGSVTAGRHTIWWDTQGGGHLSLRSGLYFVRMKSGSLIVTRQVVVMR